jgi:hypothetical protein
MVAAFRRYAQDVETGDFPTAENVRHLTGDEHNKFLDLLEEHTSKSIGPVGAGF